MRFQVFPASVRSGASGISSGTGYLFGFLANKLFLTMLAAMTMPGTFWFYSAVALLGALVLYYVLPETEGRSLVEIERYFVDNVPLKPSTLAPHTAHIAAQTVLGGIAGARFQDHVVEVGSNKVAASDRMDITKWESTRVFQKHLDAHRNRLDAGLKLKHNHQANGDERVADVMGNVDDNNLVQFTQPQWRHNEHQQKRGQNAHVAAMSEMTHL